MRERAQKPYTLNPLGLKGPFATKHPPSRKGGRDRSVSLGGACTGDFGGAARPSVRG